MTKSETSMTNQIRNPNDERNIMREITSHKLNGLNNCIKIEAADARDAGGAHHVYLLSGVQGPLDHHPIPTTEIKFQNGPIAEVGANGHSNEALLAILIDRLQCFQLGNYNCRENAIALTHLEDAMHWLQHRTRARLGRGVEGTSQV
jgi:hypothetical protein